MAFGYNVRGLAKLLHYLAYVKAQSGEERDIIAEESKNYPYQVKDKIEV